MSFLSLLSHILCAWFAFFLPCYSTFKALSQRPVSEPDLEKLTKYWTVIGAVIAFEYVAEWLISWFPFYWELKTTFLLFLSVPQTQGSTLIYDNYLQPFFLKNQAELDAGIITVQRNVLMYLKSRLLLLWEIVVGVLNKLPVSGQSPASGTGQPSSVAAPSMESIMGLWRTYSPGIISALQPKPQTPSAPPPSVPQPPVTPSASTTSFEPINHSAES